MPEGEPIGWLETVTLAGSDEPVRVVFEERRGNDVIVRQVDPGEPTPPRTPLYEGDHPVVMTAVSHIGIHTSGEVGAVADLVHSMRVVPVRREGSTIFARSLRVGEEDDGRRVHVRPGDTVTFEAGAIVAELDAIDAREQATESGYVPLAGVLSAWFHIDPQDWMPELVRYALAAARRLDMANELLIRASTLEEEVNASPSLSGPELRRYMFNIVGLVELAIISLGRGIRMIRDAPGQFDLSHEVPESLNSAYPALNAIRNAYEHIEDRAFGTVYGAPSDEALTIFDYERLLREDIITYGDFTLDIANEVPDLLAEARAALKVFVGTAVPPRGVTPDSPGPTDPTIEAIG